MTNAAFKLEDSGFTRDQVDALTDFMDGSVASKADIAELKGELKADIERLEGKMKTEFANVRGEIKVLRWLGGVLIACVISLVMKAFFL